MTRSTLQEWEDDVLAALLGEEPPKDPPRDDGAEADPQGDEGEASEGSSDGA